MSLWESNTTNVNKSFALWPIRWETQTTGYRFLLTKLCIINLHFYCRISVSWRLAKHCRVCVHCTDCTPCRGPDCWTIDCCGMTGNSVVRWENETRKSHINIVISSIDLKFLVRHEGGGDATFPWNMVKEIVKNVNIFRNICKKNTEIFIEIINLPSK